VVVIAMIIGGSRTPLKLAQQLATAPRRESRTSL
jgi:hypothetical protein